MITVMALFLTWSAHAQQPVYSFSAEIQDQLRQSMGVAAAALAGGGRANLRLFFE